MDEAKVKIDRLEQVANITRDELKTFSPTEFDFIQRLIYAATQKAIYATRPDGSPQDPLNDEKVVANMMARFSIKSHEARALLVKAEEFLSIGALGSMEDMKHTIMAHLSDVVTELRHRMVRDEVKVETRPMTVWSVATDAKGDALLDGNGKAVQVKRTENREIIRVQRDKTDSAAISGVTKALALMMKLAGLDRKTSLNLNVSKHEHQHTHITASDMANLPNEQLAALLGAESVVDAEGFEVKESDDESSRDGGEGAA